MPRLKKNLTSLSLSPSGGVKLNGLSGLVWLASVFADCWLFVEVCNCTAFYRNEFSVRAPRLYSTPSGVDYQPGATANISLQAGG